MICCKKILLILSLASMQLTAEVQEVILIWQPGLCGPKCVEALYKQLGKIGGLDKMAIDEGQGRASLIWKTNAPFAFQPINNAVRMVGIRVNDLRLKVTGSIVQNGNQLKLISRGDNTAFNLINPLVPQQNRYSTPRSIFNRQLSPETTATLLDLMKNKQIVTIEGQFFEPYRSPPINLVVENIKVEPPPAAPVPNGAKGVIRR